jgi:hypothetical protein
VPALVPSSLERLSSSPPIIGTVQIFYHKRQTDGAQTTKERYNEHVG